MTPSPTAQRPKRPRASPSRIVPVVPPPPAPLLRVFVPGMPLSANHAYIKRKHASGQNKRDRLLNPYALAWRDAIATMVSPWKFPESAPRPTLSVDCVFIGGRADVDNLLKLALDGVKFGLAVDDRYVQRVSAEKRAKTPTIDRGVWIEVTCLPSTIKQPRKRKTTTP